MERLELLWKEVEEEPRREKLEAYSMLTLKPGLDGVVSRAGLPVDAAVVLNLFIVGKIGRAGAVAALEEAYPGKGGTWMGWAKRAGGEHGGEGSAVDAAE